MVTFDLVADAIAGSDDDLYAIAARLDADVDTLRGHLAEWEDLGLIYRWPDNGVTRYGVARAGRLAA